jgi:hypothetical protein
VGVYPPLVPTSHVAGEAINCVNQTVTPAPLLIAAQGYVVGVTEQDGMRPNEDFACGCIVGKSGGGEPHANVSRTAVDRVNASAGRDRVNVSAGGDRINVSAGRDRIYASAGGDRIYASGGWGQPCV